MTITIQCLITIAGVILVSLILDVVAPVKESEEERKRNAKNSK